LDWDLYSFAGAAFSDSAFYTVRFPRRPSGVCPALAPKRSDLTDIFVGPAEADKQQQKKKCQEYVANERQTYESTIADRVAEAQRKFAAYSPVEPEFTAIVDLLKRIREGDTTFSVVVSDGGETALPGFRGPIAAPSARKTVILAIIAPEKMNGSRSEYFEHMQRVWLTRAPWLKAVIPASRIGADTFGPIPGPMSTESAVARVSK
jgi:hypothetical protein